MKTVAQAILATLLGLVPVAALSAQPSPSGDSPLKLHEWVMPFYPTQLIMAGVVTGEIQIAIEVDAAGRLTDTLVLAYTDQGLVAPTLAAVRKWTFEPAVVNGEARSTTRGILFNFRPDGPVVVENGGFGGSGPYQVGIAGLNGRQIEYQISELRDLDRIPAPVRIVRPAKAIKADKSSPPVLVRVDFYIDEKGHVRMPAVSRSQDTAMGWVAVQAVAQWEFAPPTINGAPVTVHAIQEFLFKP